jgi:glycosyltransferase involved in cell wall biosynthesis
MKNKKICWMLTHPIQNQTPLVKKIYKIKDIRFEVIYFYKFLNQSFFDKDFNRTISWDINLTKNYKFRFILNRNFFLLNNFIFLFKIFILFKKEKYDIIVIQGWNDINYIISLFIGKYFGAKIVIRCEANNLKKNKKFINFFKKYFLNLIFAYIDYFAAIGKLNKKFYITNGVNNKDIFMMPYCVDNDLFKSSDANFEKYIRKQFNIRRQNQIILFVGKFIDRKSPSILLDAFISLNKKNVHLIYVGDGILKNSLNDFVLKRKIENVHFLSFLGQKRLSTIYNMSDIFVLPSKEETWGLVVNEAMAGSCAILTSKQVGSSSDLIINNFNGFVINKINKFSLKKYLHKIISSKKLYRMKKNSFRLISKFSIENNVNNFYSFLKNVA